jgi:hypothetical protein
MASHAYSQHGLDRWCECGALCVWITLLLTLVALEVVLYIGVFTHQDALVTMALGCLLIFWLALAVFQLTHVAVCLALQRYKRAAERWNQTRLLQSRTRTISDYMATAVAVPPELSSIIVVYERDAATG